MDTNRYAVADPGFLRQEWEQNPIITDRKGRLCFQKRLSVILSTRGREGPASRRVCLQGGPHPGVCSQWILRARDRDRDILARLRFGHQRPLNRRCPARLGHQRPVNRGCPWVSKPVSQDIQSICYCLHTGIFRLDTCDLVVAGVRISISPKYLYLYLALKLLTCSHNPPN